MKVIKADTVLAKKDDRIKPMTYLYYSEYNECNTVDCTLEERAHKEYCKEHDVWYILGIYSGRIIRKASEPTDTGVN